MNFKKYHVSKNLFDGTKIEAGRINGETGIVEYASGTSALSFADETVTISTSVAWRGFVTDFINIQEFLQRSYVSDATIYGYEYAYDVNKEFLGSVSLSEVPAGTKYVRISFQLTTAVTNAKIKNIMLNTGSTPLPYEPYSSEVWHDISHYIHNTSTDTITTLPAVLYPNDTTATVGLKGNTVQNGTPTPDNPIMPQGTGEKTGNLFDYQTMGGTIRGYYLDSEGELQPNSLTAVTDYIPCNGGKFCLAKVGGISPSICLYDSNKQFLYGQAYNTSSGSDKQTIIVDSSVNASYVRFTYFFVGTGVVDDVSAIMLNSGLTPLPYEPYGYKIPISSAGQTTPVYLGEVETTRKVKKLVLTGDEDWNFTAGCAFLVNSDYMASNDIRYMCTHYKSQEPVQSVTNVQADSIAFNPYTSTRRIYIKDSTQTTRAAFIAYLQAQYAAGTPVTVWYVLATEETAVVNEPLMRIGNYADEVSNVSIPVTAGGDTISVDTTVQPSEVTVNYKGWHPITNTHVIEGLLTDNPLCGISTYKDELNLATGACTRKIKKMVLTGEENITLYTIARGNLFRIELPALRILGQFADNGICTHYRPVVTSADRVNGTISGGSIEIVQGVVDIVDDYTTVDDFKSYLAAQYAAGTPVTVWYVLAESTTETIAVPSGLSGTEEGYLIQDGTPTPTNPIYPTANEVPMWG